MNDLNSPLSTGGGALATEQSGVKKFMLGVYNKLALGIALSGILAYIGGTVDPLPYLLYATPLRWFVMLAPAGLLIFSSFFMRKASPAGSAFIYWAVVTTLGLSMGIYFALAGASLGFATGGTITHLAITKAFLVTATIFGGLSLFGYTTKRDLGPIGTFAIMAIWALFIIGMLYMVLPMMLPNVSWLQPGGTLEWVISGGFAFLSAIIVAWQTQALKEGYYQMAHDNRGLAVMTNWGALNFFVSFVNIFQFVLRMMSND